MLSVRTSAIVCGALFGALIGFAIVGNVLQRSGMAPLSGITRQVVLVLFFGLFVAFGFSTIPVIVKLVLSAQVRVGNQDVAAVASAIRHQNRIIWTLWGVMGAGLVIAIPAAIAGGMFSDGPRRVPTRSIRRHLGVLAAKPDMTLDEMVAASTLKLNLTYARSAISGGQDGAFDFTIPGSTLKFPGARYYYITTYSKDSTRIEAVNIGVSPDKLNRAAIDSADRELRARVAADGWLAGHEVYRTEESRTLHGGVSEGPEGRHWLKDGVVLSISSKRMDDEKPGEDTLTAGEWILYIDLWPAKTYPGFDRYVFQTPKTQ